MKEFMLLIRNEIDHQASWSAERHQQFLKKCEDYIGSLTKEGKLISAQPLVREGRIISGSKGAWKDGPFNETKEIIVGYYHILAEDLNDAIAIAKGNPEFEFGTTARIEVRPIKTKEESTGFVYPETAKQRRSDEGSMLFMIVEHFRGGDAVPVYRRFRDQGRMAPEGLRYIASWVTRDFRHCFQIMECGNPGLLEEWMARWKDLIDFEVVPVMTSAEAFAAIGPRL